ncbi:MAG: hypothetical protein M1814_001699 [Vezdaea aestivalis]|nr:MAG: hypothetical protein M1814_001699 [Vezdaea aestivalis]
MDFSGFLQFLGTEILDAEEEVFVLYSEPIPSHSLGMIDPKAASIEMNVGGHDLVIHQSPTLLKSNRPEGTTGAVVWKITPLLADWLCSPSNLLFTFGVLCSDSVVVELGTGISGIVALTLAPKVGLYLATDQSYVLRILKQNITENTGQFSQGIGKSRSKGRIHQRPDSNQESEGIFLQKFDWETDQASTLLLHPQDSQVGKDKGVSGPDLVIVCDCIYNESLIGPLVTTCVDWCRLKGPVSSIVLRPTVCLVALQLRSFEVSSLWLDLFCKEFRVWRLAGSEEFKEGTGFVLFLGILRDESAPSNTGS